METDDLEGNEGKPVFNANTAVWIVFCRNLFAACQTMYRNRESAGCFNSENFLRKMKIWQDARPERIWVTDTQRKYLRPYEDNGTETFLPMLAGRKVHQREQVKTYNMYYYASKYVSDLCTTQNIMVRGNTPATWQGVAPQNTATLKMYADCYIVITSTSNNVVAKIRAKRGQSYVMDFPTIGTMTETELYFCTASMIQELGGLAHLYFKQNDFSKATNLQRLEIGSNVSGYSNPNLQNLTIGNSRMLEYLDVRNCPNVTGALDLSGCLSLKEVYLENTNFTGVTFATGGLLEIAHLTAPTSLTLKNLVYLTDLSMTRINALVRLCMENCVFDDDATLTIAGTSTAHRVKDILLNIIDSATNLSRVRLVGLAWQLGDTSLLDRMLGMSGIDDEAFDIAQSVLTGTAYTPVIRSGLKALYEAAWPYFYISAGTTVTQYEATFINMNGEPILGRNRQPYTQWVDQGNAPYDPVTMGYQITISGNGTPIDNNYAASSYANKYYLDKTAGVVYVSNGVSWSQEAVCDVLEPTMESTAQYIYTFSGWENLSQAMIADRTVTAKYTSDTRRYTVNWWRDATTKLYMEENVPYGTEAVYRGDFPTYTSGESAFIFNLFKGWDTSTGSIKGDTNAYAIWDTISTLPSPDKPMNEMSPVEIYAIAKMHLQDDYNWQPLDYTEITLGQDYDFSNVPSVEIGKDVLLNGIPRDQYISNGYYFNGSTGYSTDLVLFGEDSPSFTMAIDFQFADIVSNQILVTNQANNSAVGFKVFVHNGHPAISFGGSDVCLLSRYTYRTMMVMRHIQGTEYIQVYNANFLRNEDQTQENKFALEVTKTILQHNSSCVSNNPLSFGGMPNAGGYRNQGKGVVHWCKIWFDDLGDSICTDLAMWPREKLKMDYWGKDKYIYAGSNDPCNASFVCSSTLGDRYYNGTAYNNRGLGMTYTVSNVGGWDQCLLREFMNDRLIKSFPYEWQGIIKAVEINATAGDRSTAIVTSEDKLYTLSYREVGTGITTPAYYSEIGTSPDPVDWMTSVYNRAKWMSLPRKQNGQDGFEVFLGENEPSYVNMTQMEPGAIWRNNSSGYFYMFMPQDYLDMYGAIPEYTADSRYSPGGWIQFESYQTRSANIATNNQWLYMYYNGTITYTNGTTCYGIIPCFSI